MKIFIVDDDPEMIEAMTVLLTARGHEVVSSVAGSTAIPQIATMRPGLLLTDLAMAEVDGLEFCRVLREKRGMTSLKIIFVSSKVEDYRHEKAREVGALGCIEKPIDPETFADRVEELAAD